MAEATKKVERRVIEDVTIELKLNEDEARTLVAILANVTGTRTNSPRLHASNVLEAFRRAGVPHPGHTQALSWRELPAADLSDPSGLICGALKFRDYPEGA
jgi:hypothetical protein